MKKWTVMLIPHDRGGTRTLTLTSAPFWTVVGCVSVLLFTSAFFLQRNRAIARDNARLLEVAQSLMAKEPEPPAPTLEESAGLSEEQLREIKEQLQADYDAALAPIKANLSQLYELEGKVRVLAGLPAEGNTTQAMAEDVGDGKGGADFGLGGFDYSEVDLAMRPPQVIYGLSRPSADLILQEITMRAHSLKSFIGDAEAQMDELARVPSVRPIPSYLGRYTSGFGMRMNPVTRRLAPHNGIDIAARSGTPVVAAAKGTVISSERETTLGNIVRIDHGNGIHTWYAHLSARLVNRGDVVERGDQIGKVGTTGRSTGPHLHYEVHINGKPVNGRKYITD